MRVRAHRVISVSRACASAIGVGLGPGEEAIVLASGSSNGVNSSRFGPTPERLERRNKFGGNWALGPANLLSARRVKALGTRGSRTLLTAFQIVRESARCCSAPRRKLRTGRSDAS